MTATIYCSFCSKSQYEVRKFIAGPRVFACDECVMLMAAILERDNCEPFKRSTSGEQAFR